MEIEIFKTGKLKFYGTSRLRLIKKKREKGLKTNQKFNTETKETEAYTGIK